MHSDKKRTPQQKPKVKQDQSPRVGIIFVVEHDLILIKAVPVAEGEIYGESVTYPGGHEQFWEQLQAARQVPVDLDYITVPRGRSTFSTRTGEYSLLLDRCILKKPKIVREIQRRMSLPSRSLHVGTDDHYRCSFCLGKQHD